MHVGGDSSSAHASSCSNIEAATETIPTLHASGAPSSQGMPVQLRGMKKVAELVREAEKDADKAWVIGLGQVLDAMSASRMALLGCFILNGPERRRCKGAFPFRILHQRQSMVCCLQSPVLLRAISSCATGEVGAICTMCSEV